MRLTGTDRGFTLIELLIVLGILVLLSTLIIMKLDGVQEKSRSGTQAFTLADASRQVQIYQGLNGKYPCGWDSLLAKPPTPTDPITGAIYAHLGPELEAPRTILATTSTVLTADQVTSITSCGIRMPMLHDESMGVVPSDSGVEMHFLTTMPAMMGVSGLHHAVTMNTSAGSEGLAILLRDFGLTPMMTDDLSVVPPRIAANIYVVFGLGNECMLVSNQIDEAPFLDRTDSDKYYCRALGVFEVPLVGTKKAKLVGFIGPDGRTRKASADDFRETSDGM